MRTTAYYGMTPCILESGAPLADTPGLLDPPAITGGKLLLHLGAGSYFLTAWE